MNKKAKGGPKALLDPLETRAARSGWDWLFGWRFRYFLFIFLIYLLAAPLSIATTNPGSRFMLTKYFAKHGRFWILPEDQIDYVSSKYSQLDFSVYKGKIYSDKAPGPSLLMVPLYWLAQITLRVQAYLQNGSVKDQDVDELAQTLIVIFLLLFHAVTVIRAYDICRILGFDHLPSFLTSLVLAFASIWYPYTPTFFSHAIVGSLLIHTTFYLFRSKASSWSGKDLFLGGIFASLALSAEYAVMFLFPCLILYILVPIRVTKVWVRKKTQQIGLFWIPIAIAGFLLAVYHYICFEDPFSTPYKYTYYFARLQHFLNPIEDGIYILLFSPSRGLFFFMPVALLGLISLPSLYRRCPAEASLLISMFLIILIWISKFFKPDGGLAWSARHLVAVTPFLVIPLVANLQSRKKSFFFLFCVFGILSFIFNASAAWIRLWPTGGEGMTNPLFGSEDSIGHLERLFSWISLEFSSLNPLEWIVLSTSGPQSTLYRKYPLYFWIFIYLAIFSNPFLPVIPLNNPENTSDCFLDVSSSMERLHAVLGYGIIIIVFLIAHITLLGVIFSTKPGASELYKLHESDILFLLITLVCWSAVVLAEIPGSGIIRFGTWLQMRRLHLFFELLCNYGLFFLIIFAGTMIDDPWISASLSLSFIIPLAYILAISEEKMAFIAFFPLFLVPFLLIWGLQIIAMLAWAFFRILAGYFPDSSQEAKKRHFAQSLDALSDAFPLQLIGGLMLSFAITKGYFALESIPGLYLALILFLPIIEVTIRAIFLAIDQSKTSNDAKDFTNVEVLIYFLDFCLLALVFVFLSEFIGGGMVSPINIGLIVSFAQVLTLAFWVSVIIMVLVLGFHLVHQKPSALNFK